MAKGKVCPKCEYYMLAIEEEDQPMGSWVVYECRACGHTEKLFESH